MSFLAPADLLSKTIVSITLVVNNRYGLLSVSGISSKFGYQPGFSLFRVVAMTSKGCMGAWSFCHQFCFCSLIRCLVFLGFFSSLGACLYFLPEV